MGTYITVKAESFDLIETINTLWDEMNPGYENTFRLTTKGDMKEWLHNIHTDPDLKHLRYIKTTDQLNKCFPLWGLGCFQVKITLGDYLCSEMARRYLEFFDTHGDHFIENPMDDEYVRSIVEETAAGKKKAESCMVECPYCKGE